MTEALRIAVCIKQVPAFDAMQLGTDGRMVRAGRPLEMNPYCRRAVARGVELVAASGGSVTFITMGPSTAVDVLTEALAWADDHGATASGQLVSDPAFAGSDTLATARALAATVSSCGPFDLVLMGRNSVDADTGQVGPELAELLDLPFATGVRELHIDNGGIHARCEHDDGWVDLECALPAVLSCAERLCDPCKVPADARAAVDDARIQRVTASNLGPGPWGQDASPTWVGATRLLAVARARIRHAELPVPEQVNAAIAVLRERGALDEHPPAKAGPVPPRAAHELSTTILVIAEPDRDRFTCELLGAAATLAAARSGRVGAVTVGSADSDALGAWGADQVHVLECANVEEDVARGVVALGAAHTPWAILAPSTAWGREVAARVAAQLGAGLTGDAVALEVGAHGELVAWKPAFGGQLVAAITARSAIQMATVRAGVLPVLEPRHPGAPATATLVNARNRVQVLARTRDDNLDVLAEAAVVVGVGRGVAPTEYDQLEPLCTALGAELGATRKVTDAGWMPRARQIGITGRSIAPRLYVSIGAGGKFNHSVGFRAAGTVLAINPDANAPIFEFADVGIVGDWHEVVPRMVDALRA
ncbi:MAG: FAD-binding protein [Acidimicrobiia bacterium]